jgi:DNA-binding LacI/PurR family transcriptional regulator
MLSSIVQDFEKMGKIATDSIIDVVEKKKEYLLQKQLLPASLLIRESVIHKTPKIK